MGPYQTETFIQQRTASFEQRGSPTNGTRQHTLYFPLFRFNRHYKGTMGWCPVTETPNGCQRHRLFSPAEKRLTSQPCKGGVSWITPYFVPKHEYWSLASMFLKLIYPIAESNALRGHREGNCAVKDLSIFPFILLSDPWVHHLA